MIVNYKIVETIYEEIFTLDELKNYLRVSHDYDDQIILNISQAAVSVAENIIGISLHAKRIIANILGARNYIQLKFPKIIKINSAHEINKDVRKDIQTSYGFIEQATNRLVLNEEFKNKNIEIEYISSYGEKEIPYPIKQGLLMHIALMYECPENNSQITKQIKNLYLPYRILKI